MESRTEENRCPLRSGGRSGRRVGRIVVWSLAGLAAALAFALVFGILVRFLWGFTLTPLFGVPEPTYLQAAGIIILARLIFGNPRHSHRRDADGRLVGRWHRRFSAPEEKKSDGSGENIPPAEVEHYHRFWKSEGRQAFERYLAGKKGPE